MIDMLANSAYFGVTISLGAYFFGMWLKKKLKLAIFSPVLVAVVVTICALLALGMDYQSYNAGAQYLSRLLTPATVCLAIPLYEQFSLLKRNWKAVLAGIFAGALASLVTVFLLALVFSLSHAEYVTLLPKSITTAIGMPVSEELGGYPAITAAVIVTTGIIGYICAEGFLKIIRVTDPTARGVAIGTSAHAMGTTKALELGEIEGAMSSLSIAVCGLFTVVGATLFANLI